MKRMNHNHHQPQRSVQDRADMPVWVWVLLLLMVAPLRAQTPRETAHALTDKACYVAGEQLHVSICITDEHGEPSDISRVALVELADANRLCAQGMAALNGGRGWADIDLPANLHSGSFLLSVYTRAMTGSLSGIHHQIVTVVNPLHISRFDDIVFIDEDESETPHPERNDTPIITADSLPSDILFATLSITNDDLLTPDQSTFQPTLQMRQQSAAALLPEVEGHIVAATSTEGVDNARARMAMVGGKAILFDGQPQPDGSLLFYTEGIYGSQPTLLAGNDSTGAGVALRFVSPYAHLLPQRLPHAKVQCTRDVLLSRSLDAQMRADFARQQNQELAAQHDESFYSTAPMQYYDLDEWTRLNSVREILVEFVKGVKRIKNGNKTELHVFDTHEGRLSEWPALVLLDGVPVYDIDEFLTYDARLLRYVQIYSERYTFGSTVCEGVISFVSQHGLLPNRKLDASVQLVARVFPQQHPSFERPSEATTGTLWWNPDIDPCHLPTADAIHALCPSGASATLRIMRRDGTIVTMPYAPFP